MRTLPILLFSFVAYAGTTVIDVRTEGAGEIRRSSGEQNLNGAMVWNGTQWVVNATYAHKYFLDVRDGSRLKLPVLTQIYGNQAGTVATPYNYWTVERSLYTYEKVASNGIYRFHAVQYRITDTATGRQQVLRSRGTAPGSANPFFDIYLQDDTATGSQITALRGDPLWFTYAMTMDQALAQTSVAANKTGEFTGFVPSGGDAWYFLDIGGGSDLGPAGIGRSYIFHTKTIPMADPVLSAGSVVPIDYSLRWMDANGNLHELKFLPYAEGVFIPNTPTPPTPLRFVPLSPCRLMETRPEYNFEGRTGAFGPPYLNAGETRTFVPSASTVCRNIPASARAFVLNATLVPRGGVDHVTVFPAGTATPEFWTVRSPDQQIVANSAIVRAGAGGGISVYASNATDMILDISGYFTEDTSGLAFYPMTPCRVLDTRSLYRPDTGPFGPPTLEARQTRRFRFPQTPYCTVPTRAAAFSVTLTVVPPAPLAFLTAWPAGLAQPNISNINSPAGRILANSVILPASADGSIDVFPYDRTDLIIDINGYFAPDDGQGLFYFPVTQCRVANTMDATYTGVFGPPRYEDTTWRTLAVPLSPRCASIPATAKAYALNATVIPEGSPMPFLTAYPSGAPMPNASLLNAFEGQTVSGAGIIPAGPNGTVDLYVYRRAHVALEIAGYFGR